MKKKYVARDKTKSATSMLSSKESSNQKHNFNKESPGKSSCMST
jgi:hypothetical protein